MKKILGFTCITICLLTLLIIGGLVLNQPTDKTTTIHIGDEKIHVEIADNIVTQAKGLMFRESLAENNGMLFVFDREAKHSFWMANTLMPLDIVWIDKDMEIVDISADTPPCDDRIPASCHHYTPIAPAEYVLEVNGGWTKKHNVQIGDRVKLP